MSAPRIYKPGLSCQNFALQRLAMLVFFKFGKPFCLRQHIFDILAIYIVVTRFRRLGIVMKSPSKDRVRVRHARRAAAERVISCKTQKNILRRGGGSQQTLLSLHLITLHVIYHEFGNKVLSFGIGSYLAAPGIHVVRVGGIGAGHLAGYLHGKPQILHGSGGAE